MNRLLHHQHKKMITHVQHTKYCTRKNRIKSKSQFSFKIKSKLIVWLKSHIVTALKAYLNWLTLRVKNDVCHCNHVLCHELWTYDSGMKYGPADIEILSEIKAFKVTEHQ